MIGTRTRDYERVLQLLNGISGSHEAISVAIDGEPCSKARARFGKQHAYTPAKVRSAESALALRLSSLRKFERNVAVACIFYRSTRQRIDVDNLLKLVLDGSTAGKMWEDDSQVTAIVGILEYDADNPRTIIAYGHHESTMLRGTAALTSVCKRCGAPYNAHGVASRQHCSVACQKAWLDDPFPCANCHKPFRRERSSQKFCSVECRGVAQRRKNRCEICGGTVTKAAYRQCRECFLRESGWAA
jgi:Holliday junction resolvase RusA-like endonuclease